MNKSSVFAALTTALVIGGCGGHNVYREEAFKAESPYQKNLGVSFEKACEGAQLALLSQGYLLENSQPSSIKARKEFQPDDEIHVTIEFYVVCKSHDAGSIVFANAVQTKYELKKSRQSTSLSIPSAGSISLPWGKTAESLVKVEGKTITDQEFYSHFFALLLTFLDQPAKK